MEKISFVIPCYNSGKFVANTINDLMQIAKKDFKKYEYEIILINDGSKDDTFEVIKNISKKDKNITAIDLTRNFGQHSAIMAGLNECSGDIIVCLDDDGQTPPTEIKKLLSELDENTDVVYAKYKQKKHSKLRNIGSKLNDFMAIKVLNKPKDLFISSFFVMRKHIKDEIITYKNAYPYMEGLVLRSTSRIKNVSVEHKERAVGKSQYTFKKLLNLWINGFTNFSVKPLRVAILFSVIFSLVAIIMTVILVINKLTNPTVPIGWTSMIILLLIIGAIISFLLGLIGEYVGRIYMAINNNPQFVIREVMKNEKEN